MKYPAGISGEEYAAMEDGYEQGLDAARSSYEKGYSDGESSMAADYSMALDEVWPDERGKPYPTVVAAYIEELQAALTVSEGDPDEEFVDRVAQESYTESSNLHTGYVPWAELSEHNRERVREVVRDMLRTPTMRARLAAQEGDRRPVCLRCEHPIFQDDKGVWRREATGSADCPRNPARDGHEPRPLTAQEGDQGEACGAPALGGPCVLPRGHNMGQADVPENHSAHAPEADQGEAVLEVLDDAVRTKGVAWLASDEAHQWLKAQRASAVREFADEVVRELLSVGKAVLEVTGDPKDKKPYEHAANLVREVRDRRAPEADPGARS